MVGLDVAGTGRAADTSAAYDNVGIGIDDGNIAADLLAANLHGCRIAGVDRQDTALVRIGLAQQARVAAGGYGPAGSDAIFDNTAGLLPEFGIQADGPHARGRGRIGIAAG